LEKIQAIIFPFFKFGRSRSWFSWVGQHFFGNDMDDMDVVDDVDVVDKKMREFVVHIVHDFSRI